MGGRAMELGRSILIIGNMNGVIKQQVFLSERGVGRRVVDCGRARDAKKCVIKANRRSPVIVTWPAFNIYRGQFLAVDRSKWFSCCLTTYHQTQRRHVARLSQQLVSITSGWKPGFEPSLSHLVTTTTPSNIGQRTRHYMVKYLFCVINTKRHVIFFATIWLES